MTILDAGTGNPTPVRVHLSDERGRSPATLPETAVAVMYGKWDHADGYGYQPDSSFYVPGSFEMDLAPGTYHLTLSKGNEYLAQTHEITVGPGEQVHKTYSLRRWIDMPEKGWYSADDHIHIRRSPRENPLLMDWIQAEDIHVGILLRMGDFWEIYYPQYAWGQAGVYRDGDYLLTDGQEDPRTPELGHAIGIGAEDHVRYRDQYYLYDKVFDRLHELGGLTGYAHQGVTFHGYRGLTLDGLRHKLDILEIMQFCAEGGPLITDHYYQMLDLGYRMTATAGSDFPWCGKDHRYGTDVAFERASQIGNARFYTYVDGPLTYDAWKASLAAGHTFVTTGPVVLFTVNGKLPGDSVYVSLGESVHIVAEGYGNREQVPLDRLEIVGHGEVLRRVAASDTGQSPDHISVDMELPVQHGIWLAARVYGGPNQAAHTTPVYVTAGDTGFYNPETVERNLESAEAYLQELERTIAGERHDNPELQAWRYADGLKDRIAEARAVIAELRKELR
ncbi:MAG TPA: CehA/McbA family metallohydrolase [Rhodothermales bacterium]|nr:CehA/McbA family metallohydrolase [Rhodothermales bacterium]